MHRGELHGVEGLGRRRLLGCLALGGVFLASFAFQGWRVTPIWAVFDTQEGTFAAGDPYDEWIYAVCDGEEQQITVLRDGRLEGAAALESLRSVRFPDWCEALPRVDNPALAEWQAQLSRLQALTASSESAAPILEAAERMPVSVLYLKPISDWISDASHAMDFLDALAERPMRLDHPNGVLARARRSDFSDLIDSAIGIATRSEIEPVRLERWLASSQIAGSGSALQKLAEIEGLSNAARVSILERLEAARRDLRDDIYVSVAPGLVHAREYAAFLDERLRPLPRETRLDAARRLLAQPAASLAFPRALLSSLRELDGPDAQLEIFVAIADRLRDEPDAPLLLTSYLKDLRDMQRRLAATHLLSLDESGETAFALATLGAFAALHPLSRPKFVNALMRSPQFGDRTVQEACLLAIQLRVRGPAKEELLAAMLRHPRLDDHLFPRIDAELESRGPRSRSGIVL